MKRAETLHEILNHHLQGGKLKYESYDHKLAEAEFKTTTDYEMLVRNLAYHKFLPPTKIDKYQIPEWIREKHSILKQGKLRSIDFSPDGSIRSVKIGNKRYMNFYGYTAHKVVLT